MNDRGLQRVIRSIVEPIRRRVMMTVGRAVLRAIDDSGSRQTAQIEALKGEVRDLVERMQEYGFTSVPLPGADAAVVFVSGNREQGIIVAVEDRRYRLAGLEAGEVAIYDDQGQKVHLTRDGIVVETSLEVTVTAADITLTAPTVTIAGDLEVTGTVTATVDVVGGGKTLSTHLHTGVTPGIGLSGAPA